MMDRPVFVPDNGDRQGTAVLLVGTADEFGVSQQSIQANPGGGFFITEELADLVFGEDLQPEDMAVEIPENEEKPEPKKAEPKKTSSKKTSGNRAEKNNS